MNTDITAFERGQRTDFPRDTTLHEQVAAVAVRSPDSLAVRFAAQSLTYHELAVRARYISEFLVAHGARPGSVVGVQGRPSVRMIATILGILGSGAAYLTLDEENPPARNAYMAKESGVTIVLASGPDGKKLPSSIPLSSLDPLFSMDVLPQDNPYPLWRGGGLDPAYIMYTSGSTGRPKGVQVPHRAVTRLVVNTDYVNIMADDVIAQASSLTFDAATFEIWGALLNGARLIGLPKDQMLIHQELHAFLTGEGVTTLFLTPAVFHAHAADAPGIFRTLRYLLVGGDVMDPAAAVRVLAAGPPRRLLNMYGPTEAVTFSTGCLVTAEHAGRSTLPIGRPIANTDAVILQEDRRSTIGEEGELCIGGDGLALGYINDPALNAARFVPDPQHPSRRLYRTGDHARWNQDGTLEFLGREDNQLKIRGFRIELGEVEAAMRCHPDVVDAAVIAYGEDDRKNLVGFALTQKPGSASEIAEYLTETLPFYMRPSSIVPVGTLPLNENGKIDRAALQREWVHGGDIHETTGEANDSCRTGGTC